MVPAVLLLASLPIGLGNKIAGSLTQSLIATYLEVVILPLTIVAFLLGFFKSLFMLARLDNLHKIYREYLRIFVSLAGVYLPSRDTVINLYTCCYSTRHRPLW